VADVFCNRCGHRNPEGSKFCSSCGAALVASGDEPTTSITFLPVDATGDVLEDEVALVVDDVPTGTGVVVVKRGPNAGSRFVLDAATTKAGRHPESDIFLDDITVSRRHAEFVRQGESYLVKDVGSLNGTYVNRERIDDATLENGDEVQIGKFKLVFLTGDAAESQSTGG
jgi:pSer/pThr/pTyr-binding forkhead associated (FHA) protein